MGDQSKNLILVRHSRTKTKKKVQQSQAKYGLVVFKKKILNYSDVGPKAVGI